jgi:RHS repeat-associated protein
MSGFSDMGLEQSYTYYPTGKVETIVSSNANGVKAAYTYDAQNRLDTVVDARLPGANTTTYTYDPASNVATVQYPNGLTSTFTYDALNRLTELSTPPVADYKYTLGATGLRTNATELNEATQAPGRTLQWSYDNIYRLTGETITGDPANNGNNNGSVSYTLDPVGNRTAATSNISGLNPISGIYNQDDQLSGESYDQNGNTTQTANGNQYTYDSENHLIKMANGSTVVTMQYDAFGNRVSKTVTTASGTVTTQYLVEDDVNPTGLPQVVEELVNGAVTRQYTYGLQRISENLSPAVTGNSTWTPSFYGYDSAEGSVRFLSNAAGTVTDAYEYDAFGNQIYRSGTTPNNYMYRAEQYDSDLALYFLRARYYNPLTGRFLSRDPGPGDDDSDESDFTDPDGNDLTDPATLHKYLYTGGDPVNWVDPTGQSVAVDTSLLGAFALTVAYAGVVLHPMQPMHVNSGSLQALGINVACSLFGDASMLEADLGWAMDGGGGTIIQAGPCAYSYSPHKGKTPSKKPKHQKGQGRNKAARGPQTHPKYPPRKPPKGHQGPWTPGTTGWQ